jgi:stage V sporulation protein S
VGAGAINQAIKAVAIARSYIRGAQLDLVCTPSFVVVAIGESERTAISLMVERRALEEKVSEVEG